MSKLDILLNSITLLFLESNRDDRKDNNSVGLVNKILDMLEEKKFNGIKKTGELVTNLTKILKDLINTGLEDGLDKNMLLQSLALVLKEDPETLNIIRDSISIDSNSDDGNTSIVRLRRSLENYRVETEIKKTLNTFSYKFSNERNSIPNLGIFMEEIVSTISNLQISKDKNDPAIVNELDFDDTESVEGIIDTVKEEMVSGGKFLTGWQAFNRMTQGGIRSGEFVTIGALQHQYKTGTSLSLFMQMCLFNTPKLIDEKKKPLMLWISFEDDVRNILQFAFTYLYYKENNTVPDISLFTSKEVQEYVTNRLTATGFSVKILRVNPTEWTYKDIQNKTTDYESQGYEVKVLGLDYLSMIPTIGCVNTGPMGTDLRDLFRRIRNFYSARKTSVITPHQLSSDAKRLTRNGVPDASFVKEVAGKGYYSGSTQLDQEIDLEIFVHKAKANGSTYLTFQRGKHRLPSTIPDSDMYYLLKFPSTGPIPDDLNGTDTSLKSLSDVSDNNFGF